MDHVPHEELWTAHYLLKATINDLVSQQRADRSSIETLQRRVNALEHDLQAMRNTLALRVAALELAAGTHATQTNTPTDDASQNDLDTAAEYRYRQAQRDFRDDQAATRLEQPGAYT